MSFEDRLRASIFEYISPNRPRSRECGGACGCGARGDLMEGNAVRGAQEARVKVEAAKLELAEREGELDMVLYYRL